MMWLLDGYNIVIMTLPCEVVKPIYYFKDTFGKVCYNEKDLYLFDREIGR